MKRPVKQLFINKHNIFCLLCLLMCLINTSFAETVNNSLVPPVDPKQSVTYWKKYALDENHPVVERAQQIFSVLLRAWDQSRIEPGLYVVESAAGAWAASLADGNILLSKSAVETSFSFGEQRGEHLLAFILSHELAHQRADDLWHQRFFRMIGTHSETSQKKMMAGLSLDSEMLTQLEQKEAQADHDGLVLMSSVGYDPFQVLSQSSDEKDFYTLWVENVWQEKCALSNTHSDNYDACKQAQARALRSQAQLKTVAAQSMLYELGIQAFVAGRYEDARDYFTIYGRDYPGQIILSAIGLSYLAQAKMIQQKLVSLVASSASDAKIGLQNHFYFPIILDAHIGSEQIVNVSQNKRADIKTRIKQLQAKQARLLEHSASQFEKAIRLSPENKRTYLYLASAHLLSGNSYLVRGVLQGRFLPKFGDDPAVEMLLAMTSAVEGKVQQSIRTLSKLNNSSAEQKLASFIPESVLSYSIVYNLAALYEVSGNEGKTHSLWNTFAKKSQKQGDTMIFRLALNHLKNSPQQALTRSGQQAPAINGHRLGDNITPGSADQPLWIDGELYQVIQQKGARYIAQSDGTIISAWQRDTEQSVNINNELSIGDTADRPYKTFGIPDRQLSLTSGEYIAYDDYGLAIRISNNKVNGWFLYDAR